jgi:DNA-binding SARP family transcriptional activator
MLHVSILGATSVTREDNQPVFLTGKQRQILEILALADGSPVSKERLADQLWDGRQPRTWNESIESYVSKLRRQMGPDSGVMTSTSARGYALDMHLVSVDLSVCRSLLESARFAPDSADVVRLTEKGLAMVARRELLASEQRAPWANFEREAFACELVVACMRASEHALASGQSALAVELARRAAGLDDLAEGVWRQLMLALTADGRRGEALQVFADLRASLIEQLGIEPSGLSRDLYLEILREEADNAQDACSRCGFGGERLKGMV